MAGLLPNVLNILTNNSSDALLQDTYKNNYTGMSSQIQNSENSKIDSIAHEYKQIANHLEDLVKNIQNDKNKINSTLENFKNNTDVQIQDIGKSFREASNESNDFLTRVQSVQKAMALLNDSKVKGLIQEQDLKNLETMINDSEKLLRSYDRFSDAAGRINTVTKSFKEMSSILSSISSEFNKAFEASRKFTTFGEANIMRKDLNDIKNSVSEVQEEFRNLDGTKLLNFEFDNSGLKKYQDDVKKLIEHSQELIGKKGNSNFLDQAAIAQMSVNQMSATKAILKDRLENGDLSEASEEIKKKVQEIIDNISDCTVENLDKISKVTIEALKNFDASNIQLPNFEEINNNIKQGIGNLDKNAGYMALQMAMGKGPFNEKDIVGQKQRAAAYSGFGIISDKLKTSIEKNKIETGTSKQVEDFLNLTKVSDKTFKLAKSENVDSYSQELKKNAQDEMNARKQILQKLLSQLQKISIATGSKEFESAIANITDELKDLDKALGDSEKKSKETVNNIQKVTNDLIGEAKTLISSFGAMRQTFIHFQTNEAERRFYHATQGGAGLGYSQQLVFLQDLMNRTNQGIANYMGINGIDYQSLWKNAVEYAKLEEKQIYQGTRTTAARGFNDLSAEDIRNFGIDKANDLYKISKGQIGFNELTENFDKVSGLGMRSGKDAQQFAEYITLAKNAYELNEGTATSAIQTLYKDMGLTVDQTVNAMEKMNSLSKLSGTPMEQYVSVLQKIAAQYREIGLSAEDAQNVISNLTEAGFNIKDVDSIASQFGSAMAKFSQNPTQVIMGGLLQGQTDPFKMLFESQYVTSGNWGEQMANSMDAMLRFNRNMFGNGYMGDYRTLKQLQDFGFSQRNASLIFDELKKGNITSLESLLESGEYKTEDQVQESIDKNINKLRETVEGIAESMGIITKKQSEVDLQAKENTPKIEESAEVQNDYIDTRLQDANTELNQAIGMVNSFLGSDEFTKEFQKRWETSGEKEAAQASDNLWQADIKNINSVLEGISGLLTAALTVLNIIGSAQISGFAGTATEALGALGGASGVISTVALPLIAATAVGYAGGKLIQIAGEELEVDSKNSLDRQAYEAYSAGWNSNMNQIKNTAGNLQYLDSKLNFNEQKDLTITGNKFGYNFNSDNLSESQLTEIRKQLKDYDNSKGIDTFKNYYNNNTEVKKLLNSLSFSTQTDKNGNVIQHAYLGDNSIDSNSLLFNSLSNVLIEDFNSYTHDKSNNVPLNSAANLRYKNKFEEINKKLSDKAIRNHSKNANGIGGAYYNINEFSEIKEEDIKKLKIDGNTITLDDRKIEDKELAKELKELQELYSEAQKSAEDNNTIIEKQTDAAKTQTDAIEDNSAKIEELSDSLKDSKNSFSNLFSNNNLTNFFSGVFSGLEEQSDFLDTWEKNKEQLEGEGKGLANIFNVYKENSGTDENIQAFLGQTGEKIAPTLASDAQDFLNKYQKLKKKSESRLINPKTFDWEGSGFSDFNDLKNSLNKLGLEIEEEDNALHIRKNGATLKYEGSQIGLNYDNDALERYLIKNYTSSVKDQLNNAKMGAAYKIDGNNGTYISLGDKKFYNTGTGKETSLDNIIKYIGESNKSLTYLGTITEYLKTIQQTTDSIDDQMPEPEPDSNAFSGYLANGQLMLSNEAFHNSSYLNHVTDSSMDWEQLRNDMEFMGGNFSNSAVDNQAASRAMAERTGNTTYLTSSIDNVSVNGNRGYGTSDRKALDIYVYASDSFDIQTKEAINKAPASAYARHVSTQWNNQ